jgi:hypothetical protein
MKTIVSIIAGAIFYVCMAGFTYGYTYRDGLRDCHRAYPNIDGLSCTDIAAAYSRGPAMAWPFYWPGHLARLYFTGDAL